MSVRMLPRRPYVRPLAAATAALLTLAVAQSSAAAETSVLTFGGDAFGQLGNGAAGAHHAPEAVAALAGATDVAGGREHALAAAGGDAYAWGSDEKGQVGDNTTYANRDAPVRVLTGGVTAVATGHYHSMALQSGEIKAWGWNNRGQVGPGGGTRLKVSTPVAVPISGTVAQIAAGRAHSMALLSDGTVWTWGDNTFGQLGYGSADTARHATPTKVSGVAGIAWVAGGRDTTFAVTSGGDLYAWGNTQYGQVGNGVSGVDADGKPRTVLTPVKVLSGAKHVESGADHTVAVKTDGTVWTWGRNRYGQLGYAGGTVTTPKQVSGLSGVSEVFVGRDHSIAITSGGSVYTWGRNDGGQLGLDPASVASASSPRLISALAGATDAGGGQTYSIVLR